MEEDARSEDSFQSADEDDFDLPQDFGGPPGFGGGETPSGGGALPPGFDDGDQAATDRWNLKKDGNKAELEPIFLRLSNEREHVKVSKMFSYVLRHAAHKMDVRIRKDGFVRLREIMKLRNFKPYTLEELMAVVYFDEKERYSMVREFDGELLIRANQGHTMKVVESDMLMERITDPTSVSECVHGTYLVHWPFIKRQGLSKVARNHIHLANGMPEDGRIRGMRSSAELFVYVDVPQAIEDGVVFFRSKNDVLLTVGIDGWIPPKYFIKAVRIDYNTCDVEELEFDATVDCPRWPAELAPSGPGGDGSATYLVKNLEALISNCRKRLQEINELKAAQEHGQELTDEEKSKLEKHAEVYTELQSLEQRFRQHKGHRRESPQEKEQRLKNEAEAETLVTKQDRAVTPPWEKGRPQLKEGAMKASEKEQAEWAAIGARRDHAPLHERPKPEAPAEDGWAALGRGRKEQKEMPREELQSSQDGWAALGRDRKEQKEVAPRPTAKAEQRPSSNNQPSRGDTWERRSEAPGPSPSSRSGGAPPRFFNSKKGSEGSSWRDRVGSQQEELSPEETAVPSFSTLRTSVEAKPVAAPAVAATAAPSPPANASDQVWMQPVAGFAAGQQVGYMVGQDAAPMLGTSGGTFSAQNDGSFGLSYAAHDSGNSYAFGGSPYEVQWQGSGNFGQHGDAHYVEDPQQASGYFGQRMASSYRDYPQSQRQGSGIHGGLPPQDARYSDQGSGNFGQGEGLVYGDDAHFQRQATGAPGGQRPQAQRQGSGNFASRGSPTYGESSHQRQGSGVLPAKDARYNDGDNYRAQEEESWRDDDFGEQDPSRGKSKRNTGQPSDRGSKGVTKGSSKKGGKARGKGSAGRDRGGDEADGWAALGRMRAGT